jgi:hypothetical protein
LIDSAKYEKYEFCFRRMYFGVGMTMGRDWKLIGAGIEKLN